jgi:hypothetical protein
MYSNICALRYLAVSAGTGSSKKKEHGIILQGITVAGKTYVIITLPLYHRERILETSTLSCNEEEEGITKPPTEWAPIILGAAGRAATPFQTTRPPDGQRRDGLTN